MLPTIPILEVIEATYGATATIPKQPSPNKTSSYLLKQAGAMVSIPIKEAADALGGKSKF